MLRAVADTNILISAIIAEGNEYKLLKEAKLGRFRLVLSPQVITELREVISRAKFGFSKNQIELAVKQIISIAEIVITTSEIDAVKEDPDDNKIIEAAIDGYAGYIVSGDKDLLRLQKFRNVRIIPAAVFLRLISQ
ncbi:putative toxin-antitoxin system toxin component, PIN family [Candidatus Woesearchaeota archaeon]|nr:putative toxin-antitoxin system toxin component, PIN family [Candidatus Woesearchaeota archaeon]